jgi:hypothetical protein
MCQNEWAEGVEEWGKGDLDGTRRANLKTVKNCYDRFEDSRRSDDCSETMPWDAVTLGEGEKMDEIVPPRPRLSGMVFGRRHTRSGRREQCMGRSRGDEVSVCLVNNEGNIVSFGNVGKCRNESRWVYGTRLMNDKSSHFPKI